MIELPIVQHEIEDGYNGPMPDLTDPRLSQYCTSCNAIHKYVTTKYKKNGATWHQARCGQCDGKPFDLANIVTLENAKEYIMYFGQKYKGSKLDDIPTDYLEWVLRTVVISATFRKNIIVVLEDRENSKASE